MNVVSDLAILRHTQKPVTIAAGFFDGVHKGHRLVLQAAIDDAREIGGEAWVLTFDTHPYAILAPSKQPPLLSTSEQRIVLFQAMGIDNVLMLPFSRELAVVDPEVFIETLRGHTPLYPATLFCGANWRFGRKASGTPELLSSLDAHYKLTVRIVPYAEYAGEAVSSTRIRLAIQEGAMQDAEAMLGHPYQLTGEVVHGKGLATKLLNCPTANLKTVAEVLPLLGVYAAYATIGNGQTYPALVNVGLCPTIDGGISQPSVEVHIPGLQGDYYGEVWSVSFKRFIRAEQKFSSIQALQEQIKRDLESLL